MTYIVTHFHQKYRISGVERDSSFLPTPFWDNFLFVISLTLFRVSDLVFGFKSVDGRLISICIF